MLARSFRRTGAIAVLMLCVSMFSPSPFASRAQAKVETADLAEMALNPLDLATAGLAVDASYPQFGGGATYDDSVSMLAELRGSFTIDIQNEFAQEQWQNAYAVVMEHTNASDAEADYRLVSYVIQFPSADQAAAAFSFVAAEQPFSGGTDVLDGLPEVAATIGSARELTIYDRENDSLSGSADPVREFSFVQGAFLAGIQRFDFGADLATPDLMTKYGTIFAGKVERFDSVKSTPLSQVAIRVDHDGTPIKLVEGLLTIAGKPVPQDWDKGSWSKTQRVDAKAEAYGVRRFWKDGDTSYGYDLSLARFGSVLNADIWFRSAVVRDQNKYTAVHIDGVVGDESRAFSITDSAGNPAMIVLVRDGRFGIQLVLFDPDADGPETAEFIANEQLACLSQQFCSDVTFYPPATG